MGFRKRDLKILGILHGTRKNSSVIYLVSQFIFSGNKDGIEQNLTFRNGQMLRRTFESFPSRNIRAGSD
jgi:hypothetical protein